MSHEARQDPAWLIFDVGQNMVTDVKFRKADFARRAHHAPADVQTHPCGTIRYIPVHDFGGPMADAWCEFSAEVALVELIVAAVGKRSPGIWVRRDADAPQFLKVLAVVDDSVVAKEGFEQILAVVALHPWCADGFRSLSAGSDLVPLPTL